MKGKKDIIITGAAGFIGSTLANKLALDKNYNLILIDSLKYGNVLNLSNNLRDKLIVTNCLDIEELEMLIPERAIIFHFAGVSSLPECESDFVNAIMNNFVTTVNVSQVAIKKSCEKFIFASTSAVYENTKGEQFVETDKITPDLFYSFTKYLSEQHLQTISKKHYGLNTIVCRFFNVYGYKQDVKRVNPPLTGYLANCLYVNKEAIIYNQNNEVKRDYIFITDLINGLVAVLNAPVEKNYECINFSSGLSYSVSDIIRAFNEIGLATLKVKYKEPSRIWNKYPNLDILLGEKRILKEVNKSAHGNNTKLQRLLSSDYQFVKMYEGVKLMYDSMVNERD